VADADTLTCQYGGDVDVFAVYTAAPESGREDAIVERTRAKGLVQAEFVRIASFDLCELRF
jgi:hypothetical protein